MPGGRTTTKHYPLDPRPLHFPRRHPAKSGVHQCHSGLGWGPAGAEDSWPPIRRSDVDVRLVRVKHSRATACPGSRSDHASRRPLVVAQMVARLVVRWLVHRRGAVHGRSCRAVPVLSSHLLFSHTTFMAVVLFSLLLSLTFELVVFEIRSEQRRQLSSPSSFFESTSSTLTQQQRLGPFPFQRAWPNCGSNLPRFPRPREADVLRISRVGSTEGPLSPWGKGAIALVSYMLR